ncbi:MAG: hypothetical protein ACREKS_02685 [Candidatus Rokuibacteriota bacterium]
MTTDGTPPDAVPRAYSDGHPLDQIHYREYKLILRPACFGSARSFAEFSKLVRHAAEQLEVALFREDGSDNQIREVLFFDTPAFDLYNNAFILRRRTTYQNGWPLDDHELVLKFRHPDADTAAQVDVRPAGGARYEMKFKEELLTPRDELGGMRSLFSHNCTLEAPPPLRDRPFEDVASVFPTLRRLRIAAGTAVQLVNNLAAEEVLADLGELHFGHGLKAKANIAIWRDRGSQNPLVGEFAFQCKFERYAELHQKAKRRADEFFRALQLAARDWIQLNATKTGVIYAMGRTPVTNRE